MPDDPLRAKLIADTFLENAKCVMTVCNVLGYTGSYKGKPISVMASGMGIPSISIYASELYSDYGVEEIILIGSCGSIQDDIVLGDIIASMAASKGSNVNRQRLNNWDFAACANFSLLSKVVNIDEKQNQKIAVGSVFTADLFYTPHFEAFETMKKLGILGVEMKLLDYMR